MYIAIDIKNCSGMPSKLSAVYHSLLCYVFFTCHWWHWFIYTVT